MAYKRFFNESKRNLKERNSRDNTYFFPTTGFADSYVEFDGEYVDASANLWVGSGLEDILEEEGREEDWDKKSSAFFKQVDRIMSKNLRGYSYDGSGAEYFGDSNETMYITYNLADSSNYDSSINYENDYSSEISDFDRRMDRSQSEINSLVEKMFDFDPERY